MVKNYRKMFYKDLKLCKINIEKESLMNCDIFSYLIKKVDICLPTEIVKKFVREDLCVF